MKSLTKTCHNKLHLYYDYYLHRNPNSCETTVHDIGDYGQQKFYSEVAPKSTRMWSKSPFIHS